MGKTKDLERAVAEKLLLKGIDDPKKADAAAWYAAIAAIVRERLEDGRRLCDARIEAGRTKRVAYLCMEFLVGRLLLTHLEALGLRGECEALLLRYGHTLEEVRDCACDPGLGNGGLGRLAACYLDSLSHLGYAAIGYSICYENGLFRQKLVDGAQVELPDDWMPAGGVFLMPRPELAVTVRFGGRVEERQEGDAMHVVHTEYDEVRAVPYDLLIPGEGGQTVNTLRLWRAKDMSPLPSGAESQGEYVKALQEKSAAAELSRRLYPPDHHEEGKLLRLSQQYFLVSASLQNLIVEHFARGEAPDTLSELVAIHINDTHPALVIPELMRLLMDVYSFGWEAAWTIVKGTVSYTNHTVMPEALECWRTDLFAIRLPRLYAIVQEINRRESAELWRAFPGDFERISDMAVVAYGQVRMANLSVIGAHTVNGVSRLHSEILKETVFADFYRYTPEKFTSVTNGVAHRRWLLHANRPLTALLDSVLGTAYRQDPCRLSDLLSYREDRGVLAGLSDAKRENKIRFSRFLMARGARPLDPDAMFDVQIKRMHEYKRQLLSVLKILSLWQEIETAPPPRPLVFLFGAKAAAGYHMAKELIRLIVALGEAISADKRARELLRVEFCEDYNVSLAEVLIPAADLSEQISLAGKEASGTGCMKLMMNGAVTIGTRDGANVEICEAVGEENCYMFGLSNREVEALWRDGYEARSFYRASPALRAAVDRLYAPLAGRDMSHIAEYLIAGGGRVADPYMCLADFDAYRMRYESALADYADEEAWAKRSLANIALSGRFSSDRSVREYAERIWHLGRIPT